MIIMTIKILDDDDDHFGDHLGFQSLGSLKYHRDGFLKSSIELPLHVNKNFCNGINSFLQRLLTQNLLLGKMI